MSRHRKAYDDDDMYDYDDDYYEEDYYYEESTAYEQNSDNAPSSSSAPKLDPAACVNFVLESLGQTHLSEARVLQMLEMYDCDIEKTIAFFSKEQQAQKTNAVSAKVPVSISSKPTPKPAAAKIAPSKTPQRNPSSSKPTSSSQANQDIARLGLTSVDGQGVADTKPPSTKVPSTSTLLTDNASLSDDEYESDSKLASSSGEVLGRLTMVVAGHVDAGKSTLVGNLLFKTGQIAQRTVHKYQKESSEVGKGSFALAWVMDESSSEREHGVTIGIAERVIVTDSRVLTILDAPGHRDYIPNMISGATSADVALLVIPAAAGEFETSIGTKSQTREHAVLLKALGVNQVLVAVNKMDMAQPSWSKERFDAVSQLVLALLMELQFAPRAVRFVPVSGLAGENLVSLSDSCPLKTWYSGPTLLEAVHAFKEPPRQVTGRPFRAVISTVLTEQARGCDVKVNVLQGRINEGRGVGLASGSGAATVKKICTEDGTPLPVLRAGDTAILTLVDRSGRTGEEMSLCDGMVLCKGPPLARCVRVFKATILTMAELLVPIIPGTAFELYLHGEEVCCTIERIYRMSSVGKSEKIKSPKCLPGNRSAYVLIRAERDVCIEPFSECRALGRFALRIKGSTAAVGICEKIKPLLE